MKTLLKIVPSNPPDKQKNTLAPSRYEKIVNKLMTLLTKQEEQLPSLENIIRIDAMQTLELKSFKERTIYESKENMYMLLLDTYNINLKDATSPEVYKYTNKSPADYLEMEIQQFNNFLSLNLEALSIKYLTKRIQDVADKGSKNIQDILSLHDLYIDTIQYGRIEEVVLKSGFQILIHFGYVLGIMEYMDTLKQQVPPIKLAEEDPKIGNSAATTELTKQQNAKNVNFEFSEQTVDTQEVVAPSLKIRHAVIALKYIYLKIAKEHQGITLENRNKIAEEYYWIAKNSGRKIHECFKEYNTFPSSRTEITKTSDEPGYMQSKRILIENIERAIQELDNHPKALEIAEKELEKAQSY